ncbi:hypothetical protein GCM10011317_26930 [Niveispirillum cyanobacteriorum]|nr:hypothetical protein GCM10011317_26930 [Niveispirillum cyanobacteriorum]
MLGLVADTSLSGKRVARELDALVAVRGKPLMIVSGNGTELTSRAILAWTQAKWGRVALYPAWRTHSERVRGKFQQTLAR